MDAAAAARRTGSERYAWGAGIVFVVALVAEAIVAVGVGLTQNDSATKIASGLASHRTQLLVIAYLSIIYAIGFLIYLGSLYGLLRGPSREARVFAPFVLVGGVLFITLHGVSDIGITGLMGAKLASFSAHHDPALAYGLYLTTFALDSVGDVFGSLAVLAAGLLILRSGVLPRWLAWVALAAGAMFIVQGFGLGGVIASFGLVFDLVGFVLLLIFVLVTSVVVLSRNDAEVTAVEPLIATI